MAGEHPANPHPRPANWIELFSTIDAVPTRPRDVQTLILYPWIRRQCWGFCGTPGLTTLAALSAIPTFVPSPDPDKATEQANKISAYENQINVAGSGPLLRLQIADGATVPDPPKGNDELLLAAYRNVGSANVAVELYWPVITNRLWEWLVTMQHGTAVEIEEAFRSGKTAWRNDR